MNLIKKIIIPTFILLVTQTFLFSQSKITDSSNSSNREEPGAVLELSSSNKALLLTRVNSVSDVNNPANGMIVYDISSKCIKFYQDDNWTECVDGDYPNALLNCTSSPVNYNLGDEAGKIINIPYTNGNGLAYGAETVVSNENPSLTITRIAGTLSTSGTGNIQYTVGTAPAIGTYTFTISMGGVNTCTLTININNPAPPANLNCPTNISLVAGDTVGKIIDIPYTGGTGQAYAAETITSTTGGLMIARNGGNLSSANGNVRYYTLNQVPVGNYTFNINIAGATCTLIVRVTSSVPFANMYCNNVTQTYPFGTELNKTIDILYLDGNGLSYAAETVASNQNSTFTIRRSGGTLNTGSGNIRYTINSPAPAPGTYTFTVQVGNGRSCTFTVEIESTTPPPPSTSLNCPLNVSFQLGQEVGQVIPIAYSNGNNQSYATQTVASNQDSNFTIRRSAGTLGATSGSINYFVVSGPSRTGTFTFNINLAGATCLLTVRITEVTVGNPDLSTTSRSYITVRTVTRPPDVRPVINNCPASLVYTVPTLTVKGNGSVTFSTNVRYDLYFDGRYVSSSYTANSTTLVPTDADGYVRSPRYNIDSFTELGVTQATNWANALQFFLRRSGGNSGSVLLGGSPGVFWTYQSSNSYSGGVVSYCNSNQPTGSDSPYYTHPDYLFNSSDPIGTTKSWQIRSSSSGAVVMSGTFTKKRNR